MTKAPERVLDRVVLHLGDGVRRVVDPADVYYLEARGEDTRVRLRSARPLVDLRPLRDLLPHFTPHGLRQIIPRGMRRDCEVKLDPPVDWVLLARCGRSPWVVASISPP